MLPQKHYTYLWVVLLAFTLDACTPDDGPQPCNSTNTYFNLTAEQLNKTPYFTNPLFDTISFASNKGDTLTFALTKIDTTYFTQDANTNPNNLCNFWEHYQNITAKYTTIKGVGSFEVMLISKSDNKMNQLEIAFNNNYYILPIHWLGNKNLSGYKANVVISGKEYYDVIFVFNAHFNLPIGLIQMYNERTQQTWIFIN